MSTLDLAVVSTSLLENERRLPIHPAHFDAIPDELRPRMSFEQGYGEAFGIPDEELARRFGGVASREQLLAEGGVVLLPKMSDKDLAGVREGGVVWGWPHCVQQRDVAQVAIDRRQTLIAWESMHTWRRDGSRDMHLFYRNNEMAGYCGVLHAMALAGLDGGGYGLPLRAVVMSFGSVSRGAIFALKGMGVADITVYTQRPAWSVHDRIPGCRYGQMTAADDGSIQVCDDDGQTRAMVDVLESCDLIVNGILQDTDRPLMFLAEGESERLRQGALIVDVSCDLRMGFPFAKPTSFEAPTFAAGPATYYAVDHTPSYLWRSASYELSAVVVPFLADVMGGPEAWERNESIRRAIEICDGEVLNPRILSFQRRAATWPHASTD
ncbi:MAG: N5-(carboxyethyl)ornithine synthase [Pseudohongiellaceae bacterium]|jgi:N5-(carboxyethyl)ornithine synthase